MATISSLGSASGLDLNGLLTGLMNAEQVPLQALQRKEVSYNANISSFGTLQGALSSLQTAANAMTTGADTTPSIKFSTPKATVADPTIAYATADSTTAATTYSLEVTSIALAQRLVSPAYGAGSSSSTTIGTGTLKIEFGTLSTTTTPNDTFTADDDADSTPTVNRTKTITIDSTNNTLGGLRDAINASGADVTASIVNGSAGAQLVLTGKQTGLTSIMRLTMPDYVAPTPPDLVGGFDYNPISGGSGKLSDAAPAGQVASDAAFTINGIAGSSSTNTITGMIEGLTLNLTKITTSATTVTVTKDLTTKLSSALTTFINAYNDATATMSSLGAYNATTKVAGALQGNSTLRAAQYQVREQLFNSTYGTNSSYQRLTDIGVTLGKDGKLSLDTSVLNTAISSDFTAVSNLVSTVGSSFSKTIDGLIGVTGTIPSAVSSIKDQIATSTKAQEVLSARLTTIEARYRTQFTSLDVLIAGMKNTSSYLTQQLDSLSNLNLAISKQ